MTDFPQDPLVLPSANFETQKFKPVDDVTLRIWPTIASQAFRSYAFVTLKPGLADDLATRFARIFNVKRLVH